MDSTLSRVAQAAPTHSIQVTALEAALRIDSAKCVRRVSNFFLLSELRTCFARVE